MKKKIRTIIKRRITRLTPAIIEQKSLLIFQNLIKTEFLEKGDLIGIYHAKPNEAQTAEIISFLFKEGKRVFLPKIDGHSLNFYEIHSGDTLKPGVFGIFEPAETTTSSNELDIIIMPCVAVDTSGNRLGHGHGFYDTFLKKHSPLYKICLCFENQLISKLPSESHDVPVDIIVTEIRTILATKSKISKIIDGHSFANSLLQQTKFLIKKNNLQLQIAIILVGNDPASHLYVKKKVTACAKVGIDTQLHALPETSSLFDVQTLVIALGKDPKITGILLQLPLPEALYKHTQNILNLVPVAKDVDGLGEQQQKLLINGITQLASCTPKGILSLLESLNLKLKSKKICLVGHGKLVNAPLAQMLRNIGVEPFICDKSTNHLASITKDADIIISATGVPKLLNNSHLKTNAIVIDAGSGQLNGKTHGDCDINDVLPTVKYITPVPGGVGPITIATLTQNLLTAWQLQNPNKKALFSTNSIAIITSQESWFLPYAHKLAIQLRAKYSVDLLTSLHETKKPYDVVFILSYFDNVPKEFLDQHAMSFIAHESKLPDVRGWAPLFWQILKKRSIIHISLITATEDKTSGSVILSKKIKLNGTELYDDLRKKQATTIIELCKKFLTDTSKMFLLKKPKIQVGGASIYRRRTPEDSELDINKPLKVLFKQLRIASNEEFPAFFYYKNKKFILKISTEEKVS